ncbi:MAG: LLM class flavin-dependent oxidoreductase [Chloroflexi bacterium]|nr:LLM class flavin-dependent oxidoreductase [Chloroflexota bacterium]
MTTPLRIGFKVSPANIGWQRMHDMWQRAGEIGAFDSAWLFDHFYPVDGDGSCFEATTSLANLIPLVPGLQVGHLVLANPYRHPALTAKIASTLDHQSGGHFVLGLGAGWHVPETQAYGMDLDPLGARLRDLRAAILVIRALLRPEAGVWPTDGSDSSTTGGVSLEAPPYRLRHARLDPLPLQGDRLPIWLGVQGLQVGMRLVAELADGWNFSGAFAPDEFGARMDAIRRNCDAIGRDPAEIEISAQLRVNADDLPSALATSRTYIREGVRHMILYMDGRQGVETVDRVVREVVAALRDDGLPGPG